MRLARGRPRKTCLAALGRFFRELSTGAAGESTVFDSAGFIHPTAVVHQDAVVGRGVSVGPFCTVGSSVKIGDQCQLYPGSHVFGNTELGDNCVLMTGAVVGDDLPGSTLLGFNNSIGHHAVVGAKCQDLKYKIGEPCFLSIGNNNDIREFSSIHRSSKSSDCTVIGNNNLIMGSCHIAHDCKIGNCNIFANSTLLAGHVVVEISQDVPKYMMVAGGRAELHGLNLEGLRRHGFTDLEMRSLRTAYQRIFMPSNANPVRFEERLAELEQHEALAGFPAVLSMTRSIRSCLAEDRRGICKIRHWNAS
ncbi:hypothetical protein MLD38_014296 [Melastoma candidum]|uniref:Uncharacterized protein n=1 Tax=Melastoma candidum TaxID=119954 RepID=A0ACB9RGI0_9MYRT|nr:hypothetical protein MLD38_014296 [Melastoma candidum]